jgi:hypothetical protein
MPLPEKLKRTPETLERALIVTPFSFLMSAREAPRDTADPNVEPA